MWKLQVTDRDMCTQEKTTGSWSLWFVSMWRCSRFPYFKTRRDRFLHSESQTSQSWFMQIWTQTWNIFLGDWWYHPVEISSRSSAPSALMWRNVNKRCSHLWMHEENRRQGHVCFCERCSVAPEDKKFNFWVKNDLNLQLSFCIVRLAASEQGNVLFDPPNFYTLYYDYICSCLISFQLERQ